MKWLCGLSYVVLTFFGALNLKRVLGFLFAVSATFWMAAPAAAWNNDSSEPGSVLVFPHFSKAVGDQLTLGGADTQFQISVVCPKGQSCVTPTVDTYPDDLGAQPVNLIGHWVCGGSRSITHTCLETNFGLQTTVWGTITFTPTSTTPAAPCAEDGYLIVYVVNSLGQPIKFDGLTGSMVEHEDAGAIYALPALPIQAAESLNPLDPTTADTGGHLAFDGNHYKEITGTIQGPVQFNDPSNHIETALILLTLDVRANLPNLPTDLSLNFFNRYEKIASVGTSFTCVAEIEMEDPLTTDDCATGTALCIPGMPNANSSDWSQYGVVQSMSATQHDPTTGLDNPVTIVGYHEVKNYLVSVPIVGNTGTTTVTQKWAYWLQNNSDPVSTTFCVFAMSCPNPAPVAP